MPKFFIHGKEDPTLNFNYLLSLKETNKKGTLDILEIEKSGHYPSLEQPNDFLKTIANIFETFRKNGL